MAADKGGWRTVNDPFWDDEIDKTTAAQRRLETRTYGSRSFTLNRPGSRDDGKEAMFITKVFDSGDASIIRREGREWLIEESPAGRVQTELLIVGEPGNVKELIVQKVPAPGSSGTIRSCLALKDPDSIRRFINLIQNLDAFPLQRIATIRVDDDMLQVFLRDQEALRSLYDEDPDAIRNLIATDTDAADVVAVAHRRAQVEHFRHLLEDDALFEEEEQRAGGGPENVWQRFFEANPWILGGSLAGQFLTSWSEEKLEQVVAGWNLGPVL